MAREIVERSDGANGTPAVTRRNPIKLVSDITGRFVERWLPDAFVFVFALTFLTFILAVLKGNSIPKVVDSWGNGFFEILTFTAQSTLMLATGFALAHTPPVHRGLRAFAKLPKTEFQVIILTTLVMMVCSWISWGFGLIAGAIVAREMGVVHRGKVHYPLVVAASYSGFLVWHAGYGGAIPTLIATPGHFLVEEMGIIPVSETIFAPTTLIIVLALAIVIPICMALMRPGPNEPRKSLPDSVVSEGVGALEDEDDTTPAGRTECSRWVPFGLGALALAWLVNYFFNGGAININVVILSFFTIGLLLTPDVRHYIASFSGGSRAAYGIIMQFPFYAGIMGMLVDSGIGQDIADAFVHIADRDTLPFWSFIGGGIVNIFVPSGGGQWAVQGPIMIQAANQLNADIPMVAMGVAWGDAWTNMIQPFWTLPLLGIAGLKIRDIMGYTAVITLVSGVVIGAGLLFL